MYTLYGHSQTRSFRVLWMLEELEQPYELSPMTPKSEAAIEASPTGKLPAMEAEGTRLTDSVAIMTYLADKHGALTYRAGTIDRARQDGITHLINDEIDAVLWSAARHSFVLPESRRVPEIKDSLRWEFGESLARLAGRTTGDWLMGDQFTLPDILMTHCLIWARSAKFEISDPVWLAYLKRAMDRPGFQRATDRSA